MVTKQNSLHEEIKSKINSSNACCHSVQDRLSSRLLSKNVKIKIFNAILLLVVLYGYENWSLIIMEEYRLRVFENRVLRRILERNRDEITGV
jgi:hypothetical protein